MNNPKSYTITEIIKKGYLSMFSSGPYGKWPSYHLYDFSFYLRFKIELEHIFADTVYPSLKEEEEDVLQTAIYKIRNE